MLKLCVPTFVQVDQLTKPIWHPCYYRLLLLFNKNYILEKKIDATKLLYVAIFFFLFKTSMP